jgi:anhydro-N-acetylmuramic acid kinase
MHKSYRTAGIMSGSSLDAIDIVVCDFQISYSEFGTILNVSYNPIFVHEEPIPIECKHTLKNWNKLSIAELLEFEVSFSRWIGNVLRINMDSNNIHVDFISSHGHTLLHRPDLGFTWQIGCGSTIAAITKKPVVYDFRQKDVSLGGQGAPMVAIAETYLWKDFDAFLNLGGIANISYHHLDKPIAWDLCGCNQLLNALCELTSKEYDEGGKMAASGSIIVDLYDDLLKDAYHLKTYPKSLDNNYLQSEIIPRILKHPGSIPDKLNTVCRYISTVLKDELQFLSPPRGLMITGGGAFNSFLVDCIRNEITSLGIELIIPDNQTIRFKEAIMIGFCGALRWESFPNFQSSVTGAREDAIGGVISL